LTPATPTPGAEPPLRVLVVDDNRDAADSTADLLRVVGFDARACYDGLAALELADGFLPNVCLIDLNMPGMDGDALAARLHERAGGRLLVLVAVTAMGDEVSRRRTREAGFSLHLVKPVDPHDLLAVVDRVWRAWQRGLDHDAGRDMFGTDEARHRTT